MTTYYCRIGCPDQRLDGRCPRWCSLANMGGRAQRVAGTARPATQRIRAWFVRWAHRSFPMRIDHSRMYVWVHIGLACVGLAITLRPAEVGLPTISHNANRTLGLLIMWGSGLCLIACCMGIGRFMRDANVDLRTPYGCGAFGQVSVVISLVFYLWSLTFDAHLSPVRLLSLGLSFAITFALLHIDTLVLKEIWRINHLKNHPDCEHWPT